MRIVPAACHLLPAVSSLLPSIMPFTILTGVGREGQVGEAIARDFAERGATLALIDRTPGQVEQRAAALRAAGHDVTAHACDLTDAAAVATVVRTLADAHGGRADALVHLAGGFAMSSPVAEADPALLARMLAINVTTAFLATRACLPLLRAGRGSIVYFASAAALPGATGAEMSAYAIAKSGVLALMRAVAAEERAHGVRANALAPTTIRTADNVAAMGADARYVERDSVAAVVRWLCSDAARDVTGQVIALGA